MQKIILAVLTATLLCTAAGCNVVKMDNGAGSAVKSPETTASAKPLRREDMLGNPVQTEYVDGTFVSADGGQLTVETADGNRNFSMSERATNDVSALGFTAGTRLIVNYNVLADGTEEAESLEKIVAE